MRKAQTIRLSLLLATTLSAGARAADPAPGVRKPPPVVQSFVVTGPNTEADLARLRAALQQVTGVVSVDIRKGRGSAALTVKGDVLYTLLAAAARPLGFQMQHTPVRFFAASGPSTPEDLARLREALGNVPGTDRVALTREETTVALRISGIAPFAELQNASRSAGFQLRQVGGYVASGPSTQSDLAGLRKALEKVAGVEQIEMQGLTGGATLVVYGPVTDTALRAAAKSAGFTLAPLRNAAARSVEFTLGDQPATSDHEKLRALIQGLEGIDEISLHATPEGPVLAVTGDRLKPDRIIAAAAEAGYRLEIVDRVSLPSLTPRSGRNTPAAYEDAILEDPLQPGAAAPQFTLLSHDGERKIRLSDSQGKRPVVLIFGSCT